MGINKEHLLISTVRTSITSVSRRKILLLHTGASFGGIDVYLANLIDLLEDSADIYYFSANQQSGARFAELGAINVWPHARVGRMMTFILFAMWFPVLRFRLGIDTVWAQGGLGILLLPLAGSVGAYTLHTRHSRLQAEPLPGLRGVKHRLMEILVRHSMRLADRTICVSEAVAGDMLEILPANRISVIPNWVQLPPMPRGDEPRSGVLRVLFVGRLEQFKGAGLLIEAIRKINAVSQGAICLTIVGEGSYRSELENLAEGLPVRFEGFQADPRIFYQRADLFVNPSLSEGMSLTSLEAMSYGLPCIFSDIPSNLEIAGDHPAALLFRAGDPTDLAAKLTMCISSAGIMPSLGERARSVVLARFCPEAVNASYFQVLNLT